MILIVAIDAKGTQLSLLDLNMFMMILFDLGLLHVTGTRWRDVGHDFCFGGGLARC